MADETPQTFEQFWPIYVRGHSRPATRLIHFVGTTAALGLLVAAIVVLDVWWLWALVPVTGYGFAWFSHAFTEHNKPLTFGRPWWSLRADLRMWRLMLFGGMRVEVERARGPAATSPASSGRGN